MLNVLDTLNPIKTLKRGYSITKKDNKIVKLKELKKDDIITTDLDKGSVLSKVMEVNYGKEE